MEKKINIKTSNGNRYYKVYESSGTHWCYIYKDGFWSGSWENIGKAKKYDDAIMVIKSHAAQFGRIMDFEIE